jgi:dephospho-CoA kinase
MTKKVGITGGIGVGKSLCSKLFEVLGILVYYADDRAKWIMLQDHKVKAKIISEFGNESYLPDGQLNRSYLSKKVFSDPVQTKLINSIVHPAVGQDLISWFQKVKGPYALYEAALMFESGSSNLMDKVIVVDAPLELRIERVMKRDETTRKEVFQRIKKQMPQEEKMAMADYVIVNDGRSSLIQQVYLIHIQLLHF